MRKIPLLIVLAVAFAGARAQSFSDPLPPINANARLLLGNPQGGQLALSHFEGKLEARRQRLHDNTRFLALVFYKTHNRFLRDYQPYASMQDLFSDGKYNCLTGTALYALVLDELRIPYQITETTHHIFLEVELNDHDYLFEATDPLNGFVSDQSAIETRISDYQKASTYAGGKNEYHFHDAIFNKISMEELPGLLYYNQAIRAYNEQAFATAIAYLEKATHFYYSSRIDELSALIGDAVQASKLDSVEKLQLAKQIQTMRVSSRLSLSRAY